MTKETAVLEALRSEQARMETMRIINKIREIGGTSTILTLAGYILTATPAPENNHPAA
jgi:hypothetical protein